MGTVVAILVLASSTSIMSTDMYSPSLPDMQAEFDTDATRVQLTISLNMLAFGLAQLIHGPLSDRFGRRPVLLVSLLWVAVLSLTCAAATTIDQLIVARVLLGLAAAAEAVIGLAVLKDLYDETEQMRAMALLGMVIAVAPAVAPILGGFLHVRFGWESNFVVIAGLALVSFACVWRLLPESAVPDPNALQVRRIARGYLALLRNADFLIHAAMLGVALGLIFVFVTGAPFVLIQNHGIAPDRFGWYQAAIVVAFFFGSLSASRLAGRWGGGRLLSTGIALILAGACVLCVVLLLPLPVETPVRLTGAYSIMTFGMGLLFAAAPSRALRSIEGQAGTASAMLSGIEQIIAGCAAIAISLLFDGSSRPMALVTLFLAVSLLLLARIARQLSRPVPTA